MVVTAIKIKLITAILISCQSKRKKSKTCNALLARNPTAKFER